MDLRLKMKGARILIDEGVRILIDEGVRILIDEGVRILINEGGQNPHSLRLRTLMAPSSYHIILEARLPRPAEDPLV
jgi:hypothetical protein